MHGTKNIKYEILVFAAVYKAFIHLRYDPPSLGILIRTFRDYHENETLTSFRIIENPVPSDEVS
jgi:hypothetical protein